MKKVNVRMTIADSEGKEIDNATFKVFKRKKDGKFIVELDGIGEPFAMRVTVLNNLMRIDDEPSNAGVIGWLKRLFCK
ncbi:MULTISPECIES: hypothetical protein [Providencia]|uniref:Uncharacterized protein n=1 Tax=Providencia rettgeri TaxID=587 RepID=A0AAD2ZIM7_PRORE|nr:MULTISPECIES: hypothetical protein [Providencia]ELR5215883.1 hypothetical protein [Providencia rettgeri]RXN69612.1 hypothetical protein D0Z62_18080 [Providencia rettgeri]